MKIYSLRNKLLKSIMVPLVLYIFVIGTACFYIAKHEINEVYDSQLITAANVLWFLSQNEIQHNENGEGSIDIDDLHLNDSDKQPFNEYAERRQFRIWRNDKIFLNSENSLPSTKPPFKSGFSNFKFDQKKWRIYSLHIADKNAIVEVGEEYEARRELIINITLGLILPFMASLPLMVFLLSRVLRYGLSGIEKTAKQIETRSPADMSPLAIQQVPSDLLPLIRAIDSLLLRIKISLKREREFIDDAAHSLKTPLAALKIQSQLIGKLSDEGERKEAIQDILKATDRATRLVEQLLISSRIENHKYDLSPVTLAPILANSVRLVELVAEKKSVKITTSGMDNKSQINGDNELLSILFTNILDNAIKYSPNAGIVNVRLYSQDRLLNVEISDAGPGITEPENKRILERFAIGLKNSKSGNGLGLAIAKQITELLGADIEIRNLTNNTGLIALLSFKII